MAALQFEKCCCCINLRIGTLILGYLGLIGSIIMIGLMAVSMVGVETEQGTVKASAAIAVPAIILFVISLIFYALLLAGVYQRKPNFVKAAWIYMIVYTVLETILQFCNAGNHNAPGIIGILIGLVLSLYFALCVRSYELVLKEEGFSRANQGGHA